MNIFVRQDARELTRLHAKQMWDDNTGRKNKRIVEATAAQKQKLNERNDSDEIE